MSNPSAVADASERELALDPGRSFIVQAPAGSGKTELLTQRYLTLLARVESPEEVVAITFTRKAASEMRGRILEALTAAADAEPSEPHKQHTWRLGRAVLVRDEEKGWAIQANPARLRIRTIDALCASLVQQMPLLSRFGAPPRITEEAGELYGEAARNTIAELEGGGQWSDAIEHLLNHLDNNLGTVEVLIATMLARRDQWLRHVADQWNPRMARESLQEALTAVISDKLGLVTSSFPVELLDEICELANFAARQQAKAGEEPAWFQHDTLLDPSARSLPTWMWLHDLLLTRDGTWRQKIDRRQGFPAASSTKDPVQKQLFAEMKKRFTGLLDALSGTEGFRSHLHEVIQLPPPAYSDDQWETLRALFELLRLAVGHLEVIFRSRSEVDFTAVSQAAVQALGNPESPTDLALALDYRIRHLLIDEFQDTSLSQFELLERLTAGWEPDDGRTLFAVGDPMQSIYRFREAEVGLFLRARREGIGHLKLNPLTLRVNFRSQEQIVTWVNESFRRVLPDQDDVGSGAVSFSASTAFHGAIAGEAVSIHPLLGDDGSEEAKRVVELVQEARRADPHQRIAILVRSRPHLAKIVPQLKAAALRFRAIEIEHLMHVPVIQDLLALTGALIHMADRISWLAILRAPWCGLTLADLLALTEGEEASIIWERMQSELYLSRLTRDGALRVQRICGVLAPLLRKRGRLRLRNLIEAAWMGLGGPACLNDRAELEDAEVFFMLLEELGGSGDLADLHLLREQLSRLFALPDMEADDTLEVMTIHKSKGLEFDTVIVPGLGRSPRNNDRRLLMWLEWPRGEDQSDLLLAPIKGAHEQSSPVYDYLAGLEREKGRFEDGRLLYVAATRAKQRLHLLGNVAVKEKDGDIELTAPPQASLLASLWPVVESRYVQAISHWDREAAAVERSSSNQVGVVPFIRRLKSDWSLPMPPPGVSLAPWAPGEITHEPVEFEWAGELARRVGTVVHEVLQYASRFGPEAHERIPPQRRIDLYRGRLRSLGTPEAEIAPAAERVKQAVDNALNDSVGRWLLSSRHQDARSEAPLTGVFQGHTRRVVIDRTFIDEEGIRWIVDYKTSAHAGGGLEAFLDQEWERYREQLETYGRLMSARERRQVRLMLYFPLLGRSRSWELE